MALYFYPHLHQLLTDFQNSFTGKLCIHGVVGYIMITLLQIVCKVCQWKWKSSENRSI